MRAIIQHQLNSLHLMARLTRLGFPRSLALNVARVWEAFVHPWLYGLGGSRTQALDHDEK